MAHNLCIRVIDLQSAEESNHRGTLCGCTSISIIAFLVQAALITNANGVGVIMEGMHADLFLWAGLIDLAIAFNVIVIANAFVVETGVVISTELVNSVALVAARSTAVNDDHGYLSRHNGYGLEQLWGAALHREGTGYSCYYGCKEFYNLKDFVPIYFYHKIVILKLIIAKEALMSELAFIAV